MTDTVVKTGTYLYDGQIACDVRIVYSPTRYGSDDPLDPPEEDGQRESYYLQYGGTEHRGAFVGGGGCFDSLEEAMQHAAETMQNLAWDETVLDRGTVV